MQLNRRKIDRMVDEAVEAGCNTTCGIDATDTQIVDLVADILNVPFTHPMRYDDDNIVRRLVLQAYLLGVDSNDRVATVKLVKKNSYYKLLTEAVRA